ncbi:hypothetical protein FRB94_001886 [Tulasnella sp. JGI-2019a]|nr:hypothetical protein FRB94_001886 [Tulasnella sp. JGI-2019a]
MHFLSYHLPHCLTVLTALAWTAKVQLTANAASTSVRLPTPLNATFTVRSQVFKLVDDARLDPYNATEERAVEITVYYPPTGQNDGTCPNGTTFTPYMPTAMAGLVDQSLGVPSGTIESIVTDTCLGAPAKSSIQRNLIVMSPSFGMSRLVYQTLTTSLAASGYIVIDIDHPYDANVVEYPDG